MNDLPSILALAGGSIIALVASPYVYNRAEAFFTWVNVRTTSRTRRGVTDLSGLREEPDPVYWPSDEEIRADRRKRHVVALKDWDARYLRALPEAEREALEAIYRRQHSREAARRRLEAGDAVEIDLSTREGMALAEFLEAEEQWTHRLRVTARDRLEGS